MSFSSLPPELVLHTASTLDSARDIYALVSVNRGLHQLLKDYLYQQSVDHENSSGLFRAVGIGGLVATCYFLAQPRVNVHVRNNAGQTILHLAAQQHDGFCIMMILLRHARMDVNATDSVGRTPLSYAASNDDCRPLSILLRRNDIDVNITDVEGSTPFYYAVERGHKEAVKKLLEDTRLDPNLTSNQLSPLAIAACGGSTELLEMLLCDQRVNVNGQDYNPSPLLFAILTGNEDSSLQLLCAPSVNVNCSWGTMSALMWAIICQRTTTVIELLKKDHIDVNHQDSAGHTALMLTIEGRNDEVSMALLNRKDINLTLGDVGGESAVDYALKSGNSKMLGEIRKRLAISEP